MNYSNRNVLTDSRTLPNNSGDIKFLRSSETVGSTYYYGVGKRDQWTPLYNTLGNLDVQLKIAN